MSPRRSQGAGACDKNNSEEVVVAILAPVSPSASDHMRLLILFQTGPPHAGEKGTLYWGVPMGMCMGGGSCYKFVLGPKELSLGPGSRG